MSPVECPPVLYPDTEPCAGGVCESATSCACPAGLTSRGDFVFQGGFRCSLNVQAITALWCVSAMVQFAAVCGAIFFLVNNTSMTRAHIQSKTRKTLFGVLVLASNSILLVLSIRRAVSPEVTAVGVDVVTSVLFFFGGSLAYSALFALIYNLLFLVLEQAKFKGQSQRDDAEFMFNTLILTSPISLALILTSYGAVLGMLGAPDRQVMFALGAVHLVGASLLTLYIGLFVFKRLTTPVIDDMKQAILSSQGDKEALMRILNKMEAARTNGVYVALGNSIPLVLIGAWPWLQGSVGYYFPIAYISLSGVLTHGTWLLFPVRVKKSSTGQVATVPEVESAPETASSEPH